ncbi:Mg2+ transporter protein, CorA family protein [Stappia sp. 22II-S9-Z10]|nr:Mg2+ transporter protein, CorA family protein [Stappia sp. 22II-S9-Z10]
MDSHIHFALLLSGSNKGTDVTNEAEIALLAAKDRPVWIHLSADHPDTEAWIATHLTYLPEAVREAMLEPQTRPRTHRTGAGLLVILRGINFNAGADPEDMVSLRIWVDEHRIVTLSRLRLQTVADVAAVVRTSGGPERPAGVMAELVEQLTDRIEEHTSNLEERVDRLEAATIAEPDEAMRKEVADQRLELTELRRFIPPQRDAVRQLCHIPLFATDEADILTEQHDQLVRVAESLDALRERLHTIRDELQSAQAERLNRNLYVVSVISAVFLPLGFLTGLMGINVGGIPGEHSRLAFWVFSGLLLVIALGVLALLRKAKIL